MGQEIQRASVISNLPSLVRQNPAETFRRVVPKVREVLNGAITEIQLAAATSFLTILQDDIILIHTHTYSILKTVLIHLNHRDPVVSSAWLETLLSAINALPKETIKQEVLNPLLYQSRVSQSIHARLASCRILGKVAPKFESHIVKKELLPLARSLCQDVEPEVQVCICQQFESIAQAIGVDDTRTELLPELVELAGDEESSVRLAAFDSIVSLMEMMDSDDRLHVLVPMVTSVCDASSQVDKVITASLSFRFGTLCNGLSGLLSDEQKHLMLQKFQVLCITGLPTEGNQIDDSESALIRSNCCYNLPAMLVFVDPAHFLLDLYPSFSSLCRDPEVSVRQNAAATFHQVVKLLGSEFHLVHNELLSLMQDDSLEVLDTLTNQLDETLQVVLSRGDSLRLDNKLSELLSALLMAEQKVGCSLRWRLHEKLLQRYSCLARLLPGELLHQNFSPRIFMILTTNKVLPVQKEAARMFCTFLRYNRNQEQRQEMLGQLIRDLAQGRSYWNRLRFLDVCEVATDILSRKYFNKHFIVPALELVHDSVANVRYKLCRLLPRMRSSLHLPADKLLLQKLDLCVQKLLCREKDKDVVAIIRKTVLELDKLDLCEPQFHKRHQWDFLDQKDEVLLLEMEQLEQHQSDGKLNNTDRKRRDGRDGKTSLSSTKSMSVSTSTATSSSSKEMRKVKLSRSRSLSSQPTTSKAMNLDRFLKVKDLDGSSGPGKSTVLSTKDDSMRTSHFTLNTQTTSSVPVLIRSNTTSLLDQASVLDQRDHRTSSLDQRVLRTRTLGQRSKTLDHSCGLKDSQTQKLSTNRKSSSFQSGQD
ncbi:serine/threonine-protein phosphatase 4 regulatory subunit 4 [Nematolebias whitei]|uniref:serine/threonine-protein phosphatase 4 regulatory subunit 4 n=1 Tax=Nematolebias whitei TaxID=451745 RepID=UPI00189C5023|nr:serine/threonine-protein phosphatase 4 regulatory subunit 4 [Nematolebias whitei]